MIYVIWVILESLRNILVLWAITLIRYSVPKKLQMHYRLRKDRRFWRQYRKDRDIRIQQQRKEELHKKEREKYPLFFLKDGIV